MATLTVRSGLTLTEQVTNVVKSHASEVNFVANVTSQVDHLMDGQISHNQRMRGRIAENSPTGYSAVGTEVAATDPDNDILTYSLSRH